MKSLMATTKAAIRAPEIAVAGESNNHVGMSTPQPSMMFRTSFARALMLAREAIMTPIRPTLRARDITDQQWRVLRLLVDDGPTDPTSLARAAVLHAPSVTRILRELQSRGLIERRYASNGRRSSAQITEEGRAIVMETIAEVRATLAPHWDAFGRERLEQLQRELEALTACFNGQAPEEDDAEGR